MDQKSMSFEDYLSRRIQPVKVLISMLNKELQLAADETVTFTKEELEDVITTIDIFVEEFGLAAKQKKNSKRSKATDMNTAYPAEKNTSTKAA